MSFNGFEEFNIEDFTGLDNNNFCGGSFGFDELNWNVSNAAGQSQPYMGADVRGELNNYPDFPSPTSAPTSLYPADGALPDEGRYSPFYQGVAMPSISPQPATTPPSIHPRFPTASPVPTLSHGSWSLSPEQHAAPITPPYHSYPQPRVIPNLDNLGFDFLTAVGSSSLPVVHPTPAYYPSYEELRRQYPQPDLCCLNAPPPNPVTNAALPQIPPPAPSASSSGPQRTRKPARGARRYDSNEDDWDQTLVRFRAELYNTLYNVQNGQPSGGLVPAMALARINKISKEDLKRSPLRNTRSGEGKRSRDVEDYLKGLLRAVRRVEPASVPVKGRSGKSDKTETALSTLADELETKLAAVNQRPALRRPTNTSGSGQKKGGEPTEMQAKKSRLEKGRRNGERIHLERISRLFWAPKQLWSKKDVLSLVVIFLLYGPEAFPQDFVEVRPIAPGL